MLSGRELVFGRRFVTGPADSLGRLKLGPPNSVPFRRLNERRCVRGCPKQILLKASRACRAQDLSSRAHRRVATRVGRCTKG